MFFFQLQEEAFNAFYGARGIKGQESEKLSWWDLTAGTLGATCVFQRNFFIQRVFDMQSLGAQPATLALTRREVINVQQDVWHFLFSLLQSRD